VAYITMRMIPLGQLPVGEIFIAAGLGLSSCVSSAVA
jgi:hypothetical protein